MDKQLVFDRIHELANKAAELGIPFGRIEFAKDVTELFENGNTLSVHVGGRNRAEYFPFEIITKGPSIDDKIMEVGHRTYQATYWYKRGKIKTAEEYFYAIENGELMKEKK